MMRQERLPSVQLPTPGLATGAGSGFDTLACPVCSEPLRQTSEQVLCLKCRAEWPIVEGVPFFVDEFPYWGEMPLAQMQEVNLLAASGSWKTALAESRDPLVQRAAGMILNLERANWQWLLNLPAESRV